MSFNAREAVRLLLAMSMEEAKQALGFAPNANPSSGEIQRAYRAKAIQNHPDRGGDPKKMVVINVAKEILEGKRVNDKTEYTPDVEDAGVKKQRQQEAFVADVKAEKTKVESAFEAAKAAVLYPFGRHTIPFPEFLDTAFESIAKIQDELQDGLDNSPQQDPDWLKTQQLCDTIVGKMRRVDQQRMVVLPHILTFKDIESRFKKMETLLKSYEALMAESSKLVGLLNTSEDVPLTWDSIYYHTHGMFSAYLSNLRDTLKGSELKRLEKQLKDSREAISKSKTANKIGGFTPIRQWDQLEFPTSFEDLLDFVGSR
jgi:hypothetical protein